MAYHSKEYTKSTAFEGEILYEDRRSEENNFKVSAKIPSDLVGGFENESTVDVRVYLDKKLNMKNARRDFVRSYNK